MATFQGTMLYATELIWNSGVGVEDEYQRAINRMGSLTLGVFKSTPLGIIMAESGLTPARALVNRRLAKFIQRLYAGPRGGRGPEEILTREGSAFTVSLRAAVSLRPGHTTETPGVELPTVLPWPDRRGKESRSGPDCKRVKAPGHHLGRRLSDGQRRGRSGSSWATILAPSRKGFSAAVATPCEEVSGRPLLPAPVGTCGDQTVSQRQDPQEREQSVLVVRGW